MQKALAMLFFTLAFAFLSIATFSGIRGEVRFKIWVPERFSVIGPSSEANTYRYGTAEPLLSGNVLQIPLEQFRREFGDEPVEIIVSKRATVWYMAKKDAYLYVATYRPLRAWNVTTASSFTIGSSSLTLAGGTEPLLGACIAIMALVMAFVGYVVITFKANRSQEGTLEEHA